MDPLCGEDEGVLVGAGFLLGCGCQRGLWILVVTGGGGGYPLLEKLRKTFCWGVDSGCGVGAGRSRGGLAAQAGRKLGAK